MADDLVKWGDNQQYWAHPHSKDAKEGKIIVRLLSCTEDPLGSIAAMCRMYEGIPTYNLQFSDEDRKHYWEQVSKTHLKAPLEAVHMHFFIDGVDRAFTHQMVRQRTAAYAQESLRFAVISDLEDIVTIPDSIRTGSDEEKVWINTIKAIDRGYRYLTNNGIPAEDARGLLPHVTPTRLHYVTNLRSLLDHVGNRLCTQAQFIWRYVIFEMMSELRKRSWQWQLITGDAFKPVCYEKGHCPFEADFDRKCTIRERVNEGKFNEIEDSEWALNPEAARDHG